MTREPFRGGVVRGRLVAAAVLALVVLLGAPGHVIACTGETPRLEAITATARLIAEFEVVSVGPDVSVGVPGSFVARVHRIYKGSAPLTMSFEGPTPVGLCDGYIAAVGDRFVMALDARPFPAGGPYNAFWPIRVERGSAAARDDLGSLMAMAAPNDARVADSGDGDTGRGPWLALLALAAAALGTVLATRRWAGDRSANRDG